MILLLLCCRAAAAEHPVQLTLPEAEALGPNIIRIPFTLTGTLITVKGRLDSLQGDFFFDTGASKLLLNKRYFPNIPALSGRMGGGVTGDLPVLGQVQSDSFFLDNLLRLNLMADLIDMTHIETMKRVDLLGIIGYAVFQDYEIIFDYAASLLVLVRTDADGNAVQALPDWEYVPEQTFPLQVLGHVAVLKMNVGKKRMRFALDSGAEQNLLSIGLGKKFLKANFEIRKRMKLRGAGRKSIEVLAGVLHNAQLDTLRLRPMATLLAQMADINAVYETRLHGILGYEFLSQRIMGINYRKKRLIFYKVGGKA